MKQSISHTNLIECPSYTDFIDYFYNEMPKEFALQIKEHLIKCPECSLEWLSFNNTMALTKNCFPNKTDMPSVVVQMELREFIKRKPIFQSIIYFIVDFAKRPLPAYQTLIFGAFLMWGIQFLLSEKNYPSHSTQEKPPQEKPILHIRMIPVEGVADPIPRKELNEIIDIPQYDKNIF